jgi:ATP/maltotriose-dependent transcriptional regulator MalT
VQLTEDLIAQGTAALARGDWQGARRHFEAAIEDHETPAALEGLSDALFWLEEIEPSLHQRSRAYTLYCDAGDRRGAAHAALWMAISYLGAYSNAAAANGWLQRAERLIEEAGPCAELALLEHLRAEMAADPETSLRLAQRAVDLARRYSDADVEVWALSQQGRVLVAMGRVDEGMAILDEATAAATVGQRNLFIVGITCCNMLSACDRAADFERATQWCQVVDEFSRRNHYPPVFSYCRVVYGGVLMVAGRWAEAEQEWQTALRAVAHKYAKEKVYSLSRLALLRVRQGRLEEAGQLLHGLEAQPAAVEAAASLRIARGEAALALALLERRLDSAGDGLVTVPLLRLLVDVTLILGDVERARQASVRLSDLAARSRRPPLEAMALFCTARVEAASGGVAQALFDRACVLFERCGMPFEAALTRLEWARAVAGTNRDLAAEDARLAYATFDRLGARTYADRAAEFVRELGGGSPPGPRGRSDLTRRESEVLGLLSHGLSNVEIGNRLFISHKTVEHHVSRILSKLGLRSRAEAAAWAIRHPSANPGGQ